MDYFSQNEASQLVKTALNANALTLNGVRSSEQETIQAAQIDGAYLLALYRELLGPEGAAATLADTQQATEEQQKFQAAMQQVIAAATQQVQKSQENDMSDQNNQQQNSNNNQNQNNQNQNYQNQNPQNNQNQQNNLNQDQQNQNQQDQQNAQQSNQPSADADAGAGGGQPDFKSFIPEAYRQYVKDTPSSS